MDGRVERRVFLQERFFPPIRQVIFFPFIRGFIKEIAALERAERDVKVDQNCSLYLNAQLGRGTFLVMLIAFSPSDGMFEIVSRQKSRLAFWVFYK